MKSITKKFFYYINLKIEIDSQNDAIFKYMIRKNRIKILVYTAILASITEILCFTPLGMIRLPFISVTIAHIPILIASIFLNLSSGILISLFFGVTTLFLAATQSQNLLDPLFVNPFISIFPRLLIPIVTFYSNTFFKKIFNKKIIRYSFSITLGNLTNTFAVYAMIYFIYAKKKLDDNKTVLQIIMSSIALSTIWKCVAVVMITVPVLITIENFDKK
ncbi:MAG: ECF transporter S component [Clostridiales bacterium]|nr:ECF transporter S component [Clostridiales bacterium]